MFNDSRALHDGTKQHLSFSTEDLVKGDSVGVRVSDKGNVLYYVNGQNKGRAFQHLPQHQDLWGVVFILGDTIFLSEFHFGEYPLYVGHTFMHYLARCTPPMGVTDWSNLLEMLYICCVVWDTWVVVL